ncbi:hypothetical protein DFH27DRAFT_243786 [Peziza echinospora]|nr:hypothetical protein DFH27DRAFT_243786 [Peziza echinospora]
MMAKKRSKRSRAEVKRARIDTTSQFPPLVLSPTSYRIASPDSFGFNYSHSHHTRTPAHSTSFAASRKLTRSRARKVYSLHLAGGQSVKRSSLTAPKQQQQQLRASLPLRPAENTNDMSNEAGPSRRAGHNITFKHQHLIQAIEKIEFEEKDRNRLHGLVTCAHEFKHTQGRPSTCIDIKSLGHGSWNCAYRLNFSNGDTMAALVSNYESKAFSKKMKESEIATMQYLRSSQKYSRHFKVPEVYAWDLSHNNKAGAPYIFREVIEGKDLSREFNSLTKEQKNLITAAIARVHKVLSQPSEFNSIGGIYGSPETGFHVGGYPGSWSSNDSYSSIGELWHEKLESSTRPEQPYPKTLGKNQYQLKGLIPKFTPPGKLSKLCIQHFDLAIRNVVFNDKFEITGVIDWEYAQVVPLAVSAKVPLDFCSNPTLSKVYAAAFSDPQFGTSIDDITNSVDYIQFHDLIMGPDHAIAKKSVSRWIQELKAYFDHQQKTRHLRPQQHAHYDSKEGRAPLRLPQALKDLRMLDGEGPELAGNGCS